MSHPAVAERTKRRQKSRTMRLGFAFFWVAVVSYAYFIGTAPNFNTESHLYLAFSLVDRHSVNIDPYRTRLGDISYYHGHYYSDKAPGLSFLEVPVYAALRLAFHGEKGQPYIASGKYKYRIARNTAYLRYSITYLLLIMPSAILALLLWLFFTEITGRMAWGLFAAAAYAFGTIAWEYTVWIFSHQVCAILLFGAFLLLYYNVRDKEPSRRTTKITVYAGLMAGYAIICEYPTALIAALLGGYLLLISKDKVRSAVGYVAGMIPPAILALWYNLAAFGQPFATGYEHVHSYMYQSHAKAGIFGLTSLSAYGVQLPTPYSLWQITFGTFRGIFLISPVLLMFFVGLKFMWDRKSFRREFWLCLVVVVLYFLMDAGRGMNQNGWSGGNSVASRHLTPMLPFMFVPIGFGLINLSYRRVFAVLAVVSMAIMLAIIATGPPFPITDQNPLVNEVLPYLRHGKMSANWLMLLGQRGYISVLPYLLIEGLLVYRIVWLFRNVPPKPVQAPEAHLVEAT